jgi:FkbM family methyltransferase
MIWKKLMRRARYAYWRWRAEGRNVSVKRLGLHWRLSTTSCIERDLLLSGAFESETTNLLRDLVEPGMTVVDVGANIGYFTLQFAKAVGVSGQVWAFEPVHEYRQRIYEHLKLNSLGENVTVFPYGLSGQENEQEISVGEASATLHWTSSVVPPQAKMLIQLKTLDRIVSEKKLNHLDLIKIDIDGHEPAFLRGATETIRKFRPVIVIEMAQHCLHVAGSDVELLCKQLEDLDYVICNESTRRPFQTQMDFLVACANYSHSANVLAVHSANCPQSVSL